MTLRREIEDRCVYHSIPYDIITSDFCRLKCFPLYGFSSHFESIKDSQLSDGKLYEDMAKVSIY